VENDTELSSDDLKNVSMEERGRTHKDMQVMVTFFCCFILFLIAGVILGMKVTSEVFIGASLGISLILAVFLFRR